MKIAVRSTPSTSQKRTAEPSWSRKRLVSPTGITKNRPIARASETTIVITQANPPISSFSPSPSGIWASAEMPSALKPIFSDSPRATMPRITGQRSTRCRRAQGSIVSVVTSISPSGFRTATAQVVTPRIITPSSTA